MIAWDIESVTKGVLVNYPTMVSAYDGTKAHVAVGEPNCRSLLIAIRDSGQTLITHNGWAFDIPIVKKWGIEMPHGDDTIYLAYLDDETQELGLQSLAIKYCGAQPWKNSTWETFDEDSEEAATYAARDVVHTYNLYTELCKRLGDRKTLADTVLRSAASALGVQTMRGIYINPAAVSRERRKAEEIICATTTLATSLGVNFGSSKQVAALLTKRGVSLPFSEKGNPQTSTHVLKGLDDPIAQEILKDRKARKIISTYCIPYEKIINEGDGYCRPEYTLIRTRTGRSAARNLNVQNLSREFKDFFSAPPGRVLCEYDYCVAPETRIITTDLEWVRADLLSVGSELIGFDEGAGRGARVRRSIVERVERFVRPCYRVVTDKGSFTSSDCHAWVVTGKGVKGESCKNRWKRTKDLKPGMFMPHWLSPWETDDSYDAGYLAGFMDGEGYVNSKGRVGWAQNPGPIADKVNKLMSERNVRSIAYAVSKVKQYRCVKYAILAEDGLPLIGSTRALRLIANFKSRFDGQFTMVSRWRKPATILSVEYIGESEVVALRTSTRTFIAEGFQSHNCAIEFRVAGWFSQDPTILSNYAADPLWDPHRFFAAGFYRKPLAEVTKHERQIAKSAGFGLLYMGNGPTLVNYAAGLGVELDTVQADKLFKFFHKTYPGFRSYYQSVKEELLASGEVACPSGHVRHYGDIHLMSYRAQRAALRQCVNVKVQNTAAYIAYIALAELERRGLPHCGFVHDAFYFEFNNLTQTEEKREEIEWVMTRYPIEYMARDGINFDIPLTVESKFVLGD